MSILLLVISFLGSLLKSNRQLALENLALRQQIAMHLPHGLAEHHCRRVRQVRRV